MGRDAYEEVVFKTVDGDKFAKRVAPGQGQQIRDEGRAWISIDDETQIRAENVRFRQGRQERTRRIALPSRVAASRGRSCAARWRGVERRRDL